MEVDLKGSIIKRGLVNLRRQQFGDSSHRKIEENVPKTRALTLAAMFDSIALRQQQQQQCLQPGCRTRRVVAESTKTSVYGKLSTGNPVLVKVQSDCKPYVNHPTLNSAKFPSGETPKTFSSGIKSALNEESPRNRRLRRTPHFKEQRQLNHAVPQPPGVTGQTKFGAMYPSSWENKSTFPTVSKQQFIKLPQTSSPVYRMNGKASKLPGVMTTEIEEKYCKPVNFNQRLHSSSAKLKSFGNSIPIKIEEEKPAAVRSSFLTFNTPIFHSTSFPVHPVKYIATPVTVARGKDLKECSNFAEITKYTVKKIDNNSGSVQMKQHIAIKESLRWFPGEKKVGADEELNYRQLNNPSIRSLGNCEKLGRIWSDFEMKNRDSARQPKTRPTSQEPSPNSLEPRPSLLEPRSSPLEPRPSPLEPSPSFLESRPNFLGPRSRSLESAERKPLRHTSSFHGRTLAHLTENYRKNSKDNKSCKRMASFSVKTNGFDTGSFSKNKFSFRNSGCSANAEYLSHHTTGKWNQNSEDEVNLHSISVELRKKTETALNYANWDTHHRKNSGEQMGHGSFLPQTSKRRVGVYGTISTNNKEYTSSEDWISYTNFERDDLSSDGSVSSAESQSSFINETVSSDSGVCEDSEDSEYKLQISYTLSKLKSTNLHRSPHQLWCQIPEIFNSELFRKLTLTERKLQEVKFEVITSEISYAKSLNILISHFLENLKSIISDEDNKTIFANIISVKHSTEKFLIDLEKCWRKDASLQEIGKIIQKHAGENFRVYITYCKNQVHQANLLNHLMKSEEFYEAVQDLENDPICQKLTLQCFLILPMQRVTRMRLLVKTILEALPVDDSKYKDWSQALIAMDRLVQDCNDAASDEIFYEEMSIISKQLDFNLVGEIGLLRRGRRLVKKGELFHLHCSGYPQNLGIKSVDNKTVNAFCLPGFGRRIIKQPIHLFLFTDLMVIAKKASDESYTVIDYCLREYIDILTGDPGILQELLQRNFSDYKNVLHLFVRKNCQNRKAEMILFAPGETEKELWIKAFGAYSSVEPDVYRK